MFVYLSIIRKYGLNYIDIESVKTYLWEIVLLLLCRRNYDNKDLIKSVLYLHEKNTPNLFLK